MLKLTKIETSSRVVISNYGGLFAIASSIVVYPYDWNTRALRLEAAYALNIVCR